MNRISIMRYPGGKAKLSKIILEHLFRYDCDEYREPFFGAGSIGLKYIQNKSRIWINDKDKALSSLWSSIINNPEYLKTQIKAFVPEVNRFFEFKRKLLAQDGSDDELGFMKLVIHQISYSGLGTKSGGPLGGSKQLSKYKINCRWSPAYICKQVDAIHLLLSEKKIREQRCTFYDFEELIMDDNTNALLYLDPPYYVKGNELYQETFSIEDHARLSKLLKKTSHKWILSYDDCEEVRELYSWAKVQKINSTYTLQQKKTDKGYESNKKGELIIWLG